MHPIEHFCRQNAECCDRGVRGKGNLCFRGWSGEGKRIRMVYCRTFGAHFSERKGRDFPLTDVAGEVIRPILA
jgi:hypothetical protein